MNIKKEITLSANITDTNGAIIAVLRGSISTDSPENVSYSPAIVDQALYRKNRTTVKEQIALFEDSLYTEQDALIAAVTDKTNEVTA